MKQKWIRTLLLMLCLAVVLSTVSPVQAQKDKTVVYEYALLGQEYVPEQGLISATAPTGETIAKDADCVLLDWAQGSYLFEYENKIVNLKVYECAPEDTLTYTAQVPQTVSNGVATQFPGITVQSGIIRTDGAPELEPYEVSAVFWFDGQKVQTVRGANAPVSFTPREAGLWLLCYEYTDVFGVTRSVNYPFSVVDEKVIVTTFLEQYFVGQQISASGAYGFYCGKNYPVQLTVTAPDGSVTEVTDSYTLANDGIYTLSSAAQIEGETVTQTTTVSVVSGMQSFLTNVQGFDSGVEGQGHENTQTLSSSNGGLVLNMTSTTAGFRYNGIINLNELGKNTPVISFNTNHTYGGSISAVEVTLTDIYDADNKLTIQFNRNSDMTAESMIYDNTLVSATFGNTKVGANNYQPLTADAVAWNTTFHSYWRSASYVSDKKTYGPAESLQAMNFAYDTENQVVYSYGMYHLVGWAEGSTPSEGYPTTIGADWYPVANLQGSKLTNKFAGFTTGEVYLDLAVTSGRGDVIVYSIGGVDMNGLAEGYEDDNSLALEGFGQGLPAIKGMPYDLPAVFEQFVTDMTVTISKDGNTVSHQGDTFTPAETGEYNISFKALNQYGTAIEKEVTVTAIEKPELTVSYPASNVKMGEHYTVQEPVASGYGTVNCVITVNGKEVKPGDKLKVTEEMKISVTASDLLDTKQITVELSVNRDYVEFTGDFPRSALCAEAFTFPEITVYDHLTQKELDYAVYIGGQKQETTILLPQEPTVLNVEYRTERGSQYYDLYVRPTEIVSGSDALLLPRGAVAETNDAGTMITVLASDPVVSLPYKLSATSLPVQFVVLEEQLNFNGMELRLTDGSGTCIAISVMGLQSATPYLYVNGENTLIQLQKQAQTFASGVYQGKTYYTYTLEYHDFYRALMNASKIETYVQTDVNGVAFEGFQDGVYLDICPLQIQGSTASFAIAQVSNQYFYQSAFEYGDIVAPALNTRDFIVNHAYVSSGDTLKLNGLTAYDVLTPDATVTVTMTLADGTVVCQDADPKTVGDVTFTDVGTYTLKLVTTDRANTKKETVCRFTVEDQEAPKITLSGEVPATVKTGGSLVIPGATAEDATAATVKAILLRPDYGVEIVSKGEGQIDAVELQNLTAGTYKIRYVATDQRGNITTEVYIVVVED